MNVKKVLFLDVIIFGETQTEIAQKLGLSQAQISRLEKTALEKIQKNYPL